MRSFLLCAPGGAALGLGLFFVSLSPAVGQDIVISGPVIHDVLGNGDSANNGAINPGPGWPPDNVSGNSVTINGGGSVDGTISGGYAQNDSGAATVTNNHVTINGGSVTSPAISVNGNGVSGGFVFTTPGQATAKTNNVTINNGSLVNGPVYGGYAISILGGATAERNSITISGGSVDEQVEGGYAGAFNAATAIATGNSITISGGSVKDVYGGRISGGSGSMATNNSVTISGGSVSGDVYGGYAIATFPNIAPATNNTVTISGSPVFGTGTGLYGGFAWGGADQRSGNTLNLHAPITVASAKNFENWNFYLPSTMAAGGTMLKVTSTADLGDKAKVNVGIDGASSPLQAGNTVKLIDAGTLTGTLANTTANGQGMQGVTLLYDFNLSTNGKQLLATVAGDVPNAVPNPKPKPGTSGASSPVPIPAGSGPARVNPQAKALSEGFIAGPALLTQSADHLASQGMAEAVAATKAGLSTGYGLGTFGFISGGSITSDTGSEVDMSSLLLLAGLAMGNDLAPGRLTLGAFFEYGKGSYDTYNSFANAADVHSDGDTSHVGGGILARLDARNSGPGHLYGEASLRAGSVDNEWKSNDLRANFGLGKRAEYDSSSAYYGLHLGLGYVWQITEPASLDFYGKYFWTRQQGDDVTLATGDPISFDDVDSQRLRLGGRFAYAVNDFISPYIGAAYEHEFDGKAEATTNGYAIDAPSLDGDTGIGELGLVVKASDKLPLSFDAGVQGYVGKREGVTGSLQIRFEF